jgi:hypothetical protein
MSWSGSVVLEKKIFKWPHPICTFLLLFPLWRGPGPYFEQFRISFTQGWFVPSLLEIGWLVLKNWSSIWKNISSKLVECNIWISFKPQLLVSLNIWSEIPIYEKKKNIDDFFDDAKSVTLFRFRGFWLKKPSVQK